MSRDLYLAQEGNCFYCNCPMAPKTPDQQTQRAGWTKDHFIPLRILIEKGWKIKYNFVLAHPLCNTRKADRFPNQKEVNKFKEIYRKMGILK